MSRPPRFRRSERAALIALLVTVGLIALKTVVWLATGSLAVLSQALDSLLDVVALGLAFLGVRVANKPADESHHYGHAKAENLAAFAQTLLIGVVVAFVAWEGLRRLGDRAGDVTVPWYALALLVASIVVDGGRVLMLMRTVRAEGSEALRAGALNVAGDIATASVTLVTLVFVRSGLERADAIGALIVAAIVAVAAVRLGRRSVDVLMDRAPAATAAEIEAAAATAPGVRETRRVRVRGTGTNLFADVTVAAGRTYSLERAHDIAENVERAIAEVSPGADIVVHVEPETETSGLVERVQAAASRTTDVYEVHNVLVHAFDDRGKTRLHVTLHAKVSPESSLQDAHDVADRLERTIEAELGEEVRVDAHIEPLERTSLGRDVTSERPDLVAAVQEKALEEPDVADCHEVIVTSTDGELTVVAHVTGRASLPLQRIHDASQRIENALHSSFPDLGSVLLHFEPL
jgi:cation diffusion facilitator family transporter